MKNIKRFRNIALIAISVIFLGQVIISCSTSTCPVASSDNIKRISLKGYYADIKSRKSKIKEFANNETQNQIKNDLTKTGNHKKNRTSVIDHNKKKYSDNPIENENNEELDFITSNKNVVVLPKKNIYKQLGDQFYSKIFKNRTTKIISKEGDKYPKYDIFGILSLVMSLGTFTIAGIILIPLAIILGIISLVRIKKNPEKFRGKGFAIAGLSIGLLGVLIVIVIAAVVLL